MRERASSLALSACGIGWKILRRLELAELELDDAGEGVEVVGA
jgi:hypothetical protein